MMEIMLQKSCAAVTGGGEEYKNVENVAQTAFRGTIPQFSLAFRDEDLPFDILLKGFSPLIPRKIKDSSLPVAFFEFTMKNITKKPVKGALLFSFQNILGLGGTGCTKLFLRNGPVRYKHTKGNYAEVYKSDKFSGMCFKTTQDYKQNDPHRRVIGEYSLFNDAHLSETQSIIEISDCLNYNPEKENLDLWSSFQKDGTFSGISPSTSNTMAAARSIKFEIPAETSICVKFALSWWIPYYVIEKSPKIRKLFGVHKGIDHGHYYLNHFKNLTELNDYCLQEQERLYNESVELQQILESSDMPKWLSTLILNMTDSIIINSVLTKEGKYYTMEGVPWGWQFGALTGTNDQRISSHPYTSVFFPTLDKAELDSFRTLAEDGKVPHGNGNADLALDDADVPYGKPIKLLNKTTDWIDLTMSEICQLGKLILTTGDTDYLQQIWPDLVKMAEYLGSVNKNGVPEGGSTYDLIPYHPCFLYNVVLYLATLSMMVKLGEIMVDIQPSQKEDIEYLLELYKDRFRRVDREYNNRLWRKKGYYMVCEARDTLFQGGLAGDWIARYTGLKPVVPPHRAKTHSAWQSKALVDSHDKMEKGKFPGLPLTYAEATPDGKEVQMKVSYLKLPYMNYFWQTLSYQAFEAIYLGRVDAGLKIIKRLYDKIYKQGYPWDANLFGMPGFVYMTHPVMWAFFNSMTGAALDAPNQTLHLSPQVFPDKTSLKLPIFFPKFWAMLVYDKTSEKAKLGIIKSFDESFSLTRIISKNVKGDERLIELDAPFHIQSGKILSLNLKI